MVLEVATREAAIEGGIKQFVLVLAIALTVAALPQFLQTVRRVPYTLALVMVGLALAFVDVRLVELSPGLILLVFLPPLLFEASWNLKWSNLKRYFIPISLFAIFGVLISVVGVAVGLNALAGLSLTTALLIGASLSATDPVSVTALFRELGVGTRLTTLMEGESLFNDGMAVVAFGVLVGLPFASVDLRPQALLLELLVVVGVGVAVGGIIGFGISYLTQRFDLPLVEQSLTLVAAYATYLVTEDLGGSGVIGVVTTGLILGNFGSRIGMNPRTRIIVSEFWEFLAFFINSILFLLVGDQIHFDDLIDNLGIIGITVAGMLVTRAIATYTLSAFSNGLAQSEIPLTEQTVLWWGGVRGTVSIALALSIPVVLPDRDRIIATVFGAVLFTLLVQGLTIKPLLNGLNLLGDLPLKKSYFELAARQEALERVLKHLKSDPYPDVEPEFYRYQTVLVQGEIDQIQTRIEQLQTEHPDLRRFVAEQLRNELLDIEANTYAELVRAGRLDEELAPLMESLLLQEEDDSKAS